MNWIDWAIIGLLGFAAVRGFMRGFIVEVCSLVGLVLGIWGGIHLNDKVAQLLGMDPAKEALSFLATLAIIMLLVHLIGRMLTTAVDAAQLSLPNKLGGTLFGLVRKAFVLSVLLNIAFATRDSTWVPSVGTQQASVLFSPLRAFAPMVVPALKETKWVKGAIEKVKAEVGKVGVE
ncbi:MAG: CvpA family protein [Flavobacteriales bacterium]|nr:CvpA family protein [Flavobacteriales bacterium]MBL0045432.1 CvpA family protein [Flavobacteriales bacterium]